MKNTVYVCDRCGKPAEVSGSKSFEIKQPPLRISMAIERTDHPDFDLPDAGDLCLSCLVEIIKPRKEIGCE